MLFLTRLPHDGDLINRDVTRLPIVVLQMQHVILHLHYLAAQTRRAAAQNVHPTILHPQQQFFHLTSRPHLKLCVTINGLNSPFRLPPFALFPLPNLFAFVVALLVFLHFAEGDLKQRKHIYVVLLFALKLQHVVVRAARTPRILAADFRARVIDRAAARLMIKKHASVHVEKLVVRAAQHALAGVHLRVTTDRGFNRNAEMLGEAIDVALRHLHTLIDGTTEGRAFRAIEMDTRLIVSDRFRH